VEEDEVARVVSESCSLCKRLKHKVRLPKCVSQDDEPRLFGDLVSVDACFPMGRGGVGVFVMQDRATRYLEAGLMPRKLAGGDFERVVREVVAARSGTEAG